MAVSDTSQDSDLKNKMCFSLLERSGVGRLSCSMRSCRDLLSQPSPRAVCGPQTSRIGTPWKLVGKANDQGGAPGVGPETCVCRSLPGDSNRLYS